MTSKMKKVENNYTVLKVYFAGKEKWTPIRKNVVALQLLAQAGHSRIVLTARDILLSRPIRS